MLLSRMMPTSFGFGDLRQELDRLCEDWTEPGNGGLFRTSATFPAVNVWEDAENLYAEAEIPGVSMQDIEVSVVGDELTIKGARKPTREGDHTFHRQERGVGEFSRFLTLPTLVNAEKVEAVLKDGVLTITLPKAEEAKPKRISVKTS